MRRVETIALASLLAVSPRVMAETPTDTPALPKGAIAPFSGVLVPLDYPAACDAIEHGLAACEARRDGDRRACDARVDQVKATLAAVERALAAERKEARAIVSPAPGFDWSTLGWGLGIGVAVGALVVGGVVIASR